MSVLYVSLARNFTGFSRTKHNKNSDNRSVGNRHCLSCGSVFWCSGCFAKKTKTINIYSDTYNATVHSYTHKKDYDIVVSKEFLSKEDNVLIIDDFLAKGSALTALLMLIEKAGAKTAGAGIVIEKAYQGGGNLVRDMGIRVESLAKIKSISKKDGIVFCKQ